MERIENYMAKPIRWEWVGCYQCDGKGVVPLNPHDLDDDREIECPMCGGKGEYQVPR